MTTTVPTRGSWHEVLLAIFVPAATAVAAFFSWIILINGLRIPFYLYYERTVFLIYVSRDLDPVAWLVSSALAVVLIAVETRQASVSVWLSILLLWSGIAVGALGMVGVVGMQLATVGALATLTGCVLGGLAGTKTTTSPRRGYFAIVFLLVLSLLVLPAELGSLLYYALSAFRPGTGVGKSWELLELQLWYTAFPLVPFLYAAFVFSWIWAPLLAKIPWKPKPVAGSNGPGKAANPIESRIWFVVTGCFVLLAAFLGYYPYFRDPAYPLVGVDIYWRNALPVERVLSSTSWLVAAAKERHPLVVLGIAVASKLTGLGVEPFLRFAYIGLILAFGLTIFVLIFTASRNKPLATVSALVSTVSVSTTGGMYTGTIAEWIALIVWIMSLIFLAIGNHSRRRQLISTIGLTVGSLVVLFIHPWTWLAMIVGLIAYCVIVLIVRPSGYLREVAPVLLVIFLNAAGLALSIFALWKTQGWRVASAFSLVQKSLGSTYFGFGSWEILVFFSQIWSQFLNPVLLGLSILGVVVLARRRDRLSWIVLAWIVAACATNVLAAPMWYNPLNVNRGETQIFRALFLTPFQIPAAIGLLHLKSALDGRVGQSRSARVVVGLAIALLFLAILNGTFRALFPLLTDPHNYPNPLAP
jgi:hypothetical protein